MGRFSDILLVDQVGKGMWLSGAVQRHPVGGSGREGNVAEWGGSATSCWWIR